MDIVRRRRSDARTIETYARAVYSVGVDNYGPVLCVLCGAGLTIRGPHTNVRRGHFSHTRSRNFLWGCTFLPRKSWRFLVVVTYGHTPHKSVYICVSVC